VPAPTVITAALLERGHERYDIFCTPCHGRAGNGAGMIVQRGFEHPPSLVEGELRTADNKVFYDTITKGYGAMYSFDTRVDPADRWAIIAYIRALQRSQNTAVASLPPEAQAKLEAAQ
jgi:mono/diheme cytochrome c family protein